MSRRRIDERMVSIANAASPEYALEGVYLAARDEAGRPRTEGGAVVAPPHPLYGGSMDSPVVNGFAHACAKAGLSSLRFNWRGVGASTGAASGEAADADADYAAALEQIAETVAGGLVACGYSFGAAAALRMAGAERVERVLLVSPPPALLGHEPFAKLTHPALVLTGARDELAPAAELKRLTEGHRGVRFEIIPEADHFFMRGLADVGHVSANWLERSA